MGSHFGDGSAAATWQTEYEVDFTAQPNQALNADGVYVIGGRNWTVENTANVIAGATGMRIVNGTGLVMPCESNPGTQYWPSTRVEPMIGTPLKSTLQQGQAVLVAIEMGLNVGWGHEVLFGIEYPNTANRTNAGIRLGTAAGTSSFQSWGAWRNNTATYLSHVTGATKVYANNDIAQMVMRRGVGSMMPFELTSGIAAGGDWATPNEQAVLWVDEFYFGESYGLSITKAITNPANWNFFISNHWASIGAAYEQTIRKARVMLWR